VVCEQSGTIRELKEKVNALESQVRDQQRQLQSHTGLVEQCSRARLDLHSAQEELTIVKRRNGDLESEIETFKLKMQQQLSPSPLLPSSGGAAWSREGLPGLDLELLNAELRHQLDELTTQRNAANMRRERAEVNRTETQLKLVKALEDLRGCEAARDVAQRELHDLRMCPQPLPSTPQKVRPLSPPVVRSVPRSNQLLSMSSPVGVKPSTTTITKEELADRIRRDVADAVQVREEALQGEHRASVEAMAGDVRELEQLLLEETESSQRHLLAGMLDTQAYHLHRTFLKVLGKLRQAEVQRRAASHVRLMCAEATQRAEMIAEHVSVMAPRAAVWAWADQRAAMESRRARDEATTALAADVARWKRDANTQAHESSLLQSSLQKLNRARDAALSRLTAAEEENAKLFRMLSTAQTSHDETKEELRVAEEALQAAEAALQTEEQRRRLENALEEDIDDLKGTLSDLTKENRFVHATNSDMTSRYDTVIVKLRSERQRLYQELNEVNTAHDRKLRQLQADHRSERDALEDERDQLTVELEESKATARRLSRQLLQEQQHELHHDILAAKSAVGGGGVTGPRTPLAERHHNN
jgi:hypothetical protein